MVSYGWTLEEAMALTLPQVMMFFKAMQKYPSPEAVIGALIGGMSEKKIQGSLGQISSTGEGSVKTSSRSGAAFWKAIGVEDKPNG